MEIVEVVYLLREGEVEIALALAVSLKGSERTDTLQFILHYCVDELLVEEAKKVASYLGKAGSYSNLQDLFDKIFTDQKVKIYQVKINQLVPLANLMPGPQRKSNLKLVLANCLEKREYISAIKVASALFPGPSASDLSGKKIALKKIFDHWLKKSLALSCLDEMVGWMTAEEKEEASGLISDKLLEMGRVDEVVKVMASLKVRLSPEKLQTCFNYCIGPFHLLVDNAILACTMMTEPQKTKNLIALFNKLIKKSFFDELIKVTNLMTSEIKIKHLGLFFKRVIKEGNLDLAIDLAEEAEIEIEQKHLQMAYKVCVKKGQFRDVEYLAEQLSKTIGAKDYLMMIDKLSKDNNYAEAIKVAKHLKKPTKVKAMKIISRQQLLEGKIDKATETLRGIGLGLSKDDLQAGLKVFLEKGWTAKAKEVAKLILK
jgi:hypothetical protein